MKIWLHFGTESDQEVIVFDPGQESGLELILRNPNIVAIDGNFLMSSGMDSMTSDWLMLAVRVMALGVMVAAIMLCRDSCSVGKDD